MYDLSQITFLMIGCIATLVLLIIFLQQYSHPKQRHHPKHDADSKQQYYPKRIITPFESKMFYQLKQAFPEYHFLAQVAFSALITNDQLKFRAKFNRKVTDFVLLDGELKVIAIIELDDPSHLGRAEEDAKRDAMLNEAGYDVYRYTSIPNLKTLKKDIAKRRDHLMT